jgi:catechol 2,3-dioxygenase-like lactoylglutathione lyase family enzyme
LYQGEKAALLASVVAAEVFMRRFHIALAVADLEASIRDYTDRLGVAPAAVVPGKYALFRTAELNFSINEQKARTGQLRHLGFEDDAAPPGFQIERDVNGIDWEWFSPKTQDEKIGEVYGAPVRR